MYIVAMCNANCMYRTGAGQLVQQGGYQKEYEQTYETSEQRISGTQTQSSFQSFQQISGKTSYTNGHAVEEVSMWWSRKNVSNCMSVYLLIVLGVCNCWHCCLIAQCTDMRMKCRNDSGWLQRCCSKGHVNMLTGQWASVGWNIWLCTEALYSLQHCQMSVA